MTIDIGLHEVCVRVGVRYVITKFSRMDSFNTKFSYSWCSALRALRARESSAIIKRKFVEVPVFKTVGAWINKILFSLSDMS